MDVLDMYNEVTKSLDDGKFTVGIFIGLSKAFDTIDYEMLFKKVKSYRLI